VVDGKASSSSIKICLRYMLEMYTLHPHGFGAQV
jgi:hypothetical protein